MARSLPRFVATQQQLRLALKDFDGYGGAKISEIVYWVDPEIDMGGGGAGPQRRQFAKCFDLPELEGRLRKIATEDPDGLWKLNADKSTKARLLRW